MKRLILFAAMIISLGAQAQPLVLGQGPEKLADIDFYLVSQGFNSVEYKGKMADDEVVSLLVHPKGSIKISARYDKELNTKSVTITGTPDAMIYLFANYWQSDISMNELKKGGYLYQNIRGGERATFDWKGKDPVIRIIKNPDAPVMTLN